MSLDSHLDRETYRRLLSGQMPAEEARRWAEHLEQDCDACEEFLASDVPGALDGRVDAALTALAPLGRREAGNDFEFARIRRALGPARARPARRVAAFAAIAAVALLAGGIVFQVTRSPRSEWDGIKGQQATTVVPARLRFAIAGADAGAVERGASGQVLPADASLLFRIEVGAPAHVALLRAGGGDVEVVFQGQTERAGTIDVMVDGRPAVYPLRGLSGPQRFILVAGAQPIPAERLSAAARLVGGPAARAGPSEGGLTLDVIEVTVR